MTIRCSAISASFLFLFLIPPPPTSTLFPYTTLFRSRSDSAKPMLGAWMLRYRAVAGPSFRNARARARSEEHTSELQSHSDLVCRLLLEKKKQTCGRTQSRQTNRDGW